MRTSYVTNARDRLANMLEQKDNLTAEEWVSFAESLLKDLRLAALFARNASSKAFLTSTNMSEEQIKETPQYQRISKLQAGEGCTIEVAPDLYKYIRWIIKRDNPIVRLRTIKLGSDLISVTRIA